MDIHTQFVSKAHQNNDRAVMQAYGFPIKDFTESDCVAKLLEMYKTLTEKSRVLVSFRV